MLWRRAYNMPEDYTLLSYCGLYCGGCGSYEENSVVGCKGCRIEPNLVNDCPTIPCAVKKRLLHCNECSDFPCDMMTTFYNDGIKHHALAYENIKRIQEIGPVAWLSEQYTTHTCSCGKKRLWFDTTCRHKNEGKI